MKADQVVIFVNEVLLDWLPSRVPDGPDAYSFQSLNKRVQPHREDYLDGGTAGIS